MQLPWLGKLNRPLPLILIVMAGGIIAVGAFTYKLVETPAPQSELEKLTVPAQRETLSVEIKASGTVEPIQSVNISPKNPGLLAQLRVEQGVRVKQGDILAIMDNREIQAQGFQAQAKLQQAIAQLKESEISIPEEIKQAKARLFQAQTQISQAQARLQQAQARIPRNIDQERGAVVAAEARFKLAQERLKRNQSLLQSGAISQDTFDEALNEFRAADANLFQAKQRLAQASNTASPEIGQIQQEIAQLKGAAAEAKMAVEQKEKMAQTQIDQLKAAATAAQAELERVKVQYQDTIIRAPFDGIVTQKYASVGAFVTPTTSASTTASATSSSILALARGLEVVAKVPEVDIGQLQKGQPVEVVADSYPNEVFQGQVIRVAPEAVVEQNVTSFEVTIGLISGQDKLRSKMNVDVKFLGKQLSDALVVPTVAIVTEKGKTGVMVPGAENKPEFKPVTIGLVLDDKAQILSGINPGDKVFVDLPEDQSKKNEETK
jgi:HlyD family secretion protein